MIFRETYEVSSDHIDGSPAGYWQCYADDSGPFVFPIPSEWVTRSLSPNPAYILLRRFPGVYFRAFAIVSLGAVHPVFVFFAVAYFLWSSVSILRLIRFVS